MTAGVVGVTAAVGPSSAAARGQAVDRLRAAAPGLVLRTDVGRGVLRFAHTRGGVPGFAAASDPSGEGRRFLTRHGEAFGLGEPGISARLASSSTDSLGHARVDFDEFYEGVPVFGAGWSVHFDAAGALVAVRGAAVPSITVSTAPSFDEAEAGVSALDAVPGALWVSDVQTYVFDRGLVTKRSSDPRLAYRVVVAAPQQRHEVFIDAHRGEVLLVASQIPDDLDRRAYENQYGPAFEVWQETDEPYADGDPEVAGFIDYTEDTYALFNNIAGGEYPSFDGESAPMEGVMHAAIGCPNANWDGTSTNYCTGLATDDVVGHEWGHAYTQYNHALIYAYQPGALNESYSDIFGEAVDLLNGEGLDAPGEVREDGTCSFGPDASVRWLLGEDTQGFGGAIRDLWEPTCMGHPGRISDGSYVCTGNDFFDNGGVHSNSGVSNHGFALLVDGGVSNGQSVASIGMTKALAIYWRAMVVYQGVTSGFADHADALTAACADLMAAATDLPDPLDGAPSGQIVGAADCAAVTAAIAATEMLADPGCGTGTLLQTENTPEVCGGDLGPVLLEETFETDLSAWTRSNEGSSPQYTPRDWELRSELPSGRPGQAAFGDGDLYIGNCNDDDQSGVMHLDSPGFTMPDGEGGVTLTFDHWVATQPRVDGGNVKISLDGGPFTLVPPAAFTFNPYNGALDFSGNPLQTEPAFNGSDPGVPTGTWAQSQVDLSGIADSGDEVVLRFDFGVDACNGLFGWYLDDVRVVQCEARGSATTTTSTSESDTDPDSTTTSGPSPGSESSSPDSSSGDGPPGSTTAGETTSSTPPSATSVGPETGESSGPGGGADGDSGGCGCQQHGGWGGGPGALALLLLGARRRRNTNPVVRRVSSGLR